MPKVVPANVGHDDEYFWDGVAEGQLLLPKCAKCSRLQHPPSPMCPNCGSLEWGVEESTGRGTVLSWIVSRHPTETDDDARIVVVVELEEGVRLVSNLQEIEPSNVRNGMVVEVLFVEVDGVKLPQFRPARKGSA